MSRYKPYPQYKDSGVEWLGEVPEHWEIVSIKRLCSIKRGASPRPIDDSKYFDDDGEYAWVRISDVTASQGYLTQTTQKLSQLGKNLSVPLDPGELFLSIAGSVGKPIITNIKCCIHDGFVYFKDYRENLKLLFWVFASVQPCLGLGKMGTQLNLNVDTVGEIKIGLMPEYEQNAIANFLDNATCKIDTLIQKQQNLIELLKEKRQALISHAVTKGLNPHVKMKDSGVEWLGEVPEHWEVMKIKHMLEIPITDGPHETPEFIDEGVPFVSAEAISSSCIDFNKIRGYISREANEIYSKKYSPKLHDIYMVKSGATTGVTAIVNDRIDFNIWSPLAVFRCSQKALPNFLLNYLRSKNFFKAIELHWSFGTQQNIGMNVLENLFICLPAIQEQQEISNYLDNATCKIDTLITKAQKAIELLKERRTALISAAVTGKIDVREIA